MLLRRVIPCLDVAGGRVVKGTRFVDLRDAGDPAELAARYAAAGADEIVLLDITAAPEGRATLLELVERTARRLFVPLTVGGGWEVLARGGRDATGLDAVAWVRRAAGLGAGEILLTSIDRDGTRSGFDLDLLRAVTAVVGVPLLASGGAGGGRAGAARGGGRLMAAARVVPRWGADGLVPGIVQDAADGRVLMLGWLDAGALAATLDSGQGPFHSPPRAGRGAPPLRPGGPPAPACHTGDRSCFDAGLAHGRTAFAAGTPQGFGWLETLWATLGDRAARVPPAPLPAGP